MTQISCHDGATGREQGSQLWWNGGGNCKTLCSKVILMFCGSDLCCLFIGESVYVSAYVSAYVTAYMWLFMWMRMWRSIMLLIQLWLKICLFKTKIVRRGKCGSLHFKPELLFTLLVCSHLMIILIKLLFLCSIRDYFVRILPINSKCYLRYKQSHVLWQYGSSMTHYTVSFLYSSWLDLTSHFTSSWHVK